MNDVNRQQKRQGQLVYALLLLSFYVLAYLVPLGARDLFVPDEPRYAEIPREMIATGDWTVPHFNGLKYFEKPVLGYWLHGASLLLFGENNFAVRLPSALATGLSALLIFLLVGKAQRKEGDRQEYTVPAIAALIFLASVEVFAVGNTAVLDSLFSFFLTACVAAFYYATESARGSGKEKGWLLMAGLLCGLAFLTKGFLAFAVPVLTLAPYLFWQRRYADILRLGWLPIVVAVLVALPWSVRVHLQEPDFWNFFFWNEHIRRFAANDAQHKQSFWFFLLTAPGMVFPWTLTIPAAAVGIKRLWREQPELSGLLKFCLCWMLIPLLFFSLSKGKLLTYILPCFPPFAILMGLGLLHLLRHNGQSKLFQTGVAINGLLLAIAIIALPLLQFFGFHGFNQLYDQSWEAIVIIVCLFCSLFCCYWSYQGKRPESKIVFSGIALIFIYFTLHYLLPPQTTEVKCPGPILAKNRATITKDDIVIADSDSAGAVSWYLRRDNIYVLGYPGELAYGFGYPDAKARLLDFKSASALIEQNRGKTVVVARVENYGRWRDKLPPPSSQERNGKEGYEIVRF
ncbi:MAG: phospholipid carrier-dependent glycosyltransferase [Desulfobulbaceae bacterium]|nr:phospholipid carrier-dependent glycosyltransferase [Desulfobulbaceae bacterium]